ncbi:MAG: type I phosphomannose isomerase catalytic subunit [Pirellulales bacterium]
MLPALYPLRFQPILRRYLWGGRRLGSMLGKPLGPQDDYAESWEVCDHRADQSLVTAGALQGAALCELVQGRPVELLGRHAPQPRFPLLFKFLDAEQTLSVQVHPDDELAAREQPPDLGKTEAWVVLAARPGSLIYAGLKRGFDRRALERELARGTCELCLHRFEARPGDCVFLPAGLVHAIGAGLVIAEIQQASDTTYRLFDWNRVGADGRPRPLHVEKALEAIDFEHGPAVPRQPQPTERAHAERLAECDKFVLDRWSFHTPQSAGGDDRCHIIAVLSGRIRIEGDPHVEPLPAGGTCLLPAALGAVPIVPLEPTLLLDMYLP